MSGKTNGHLIGWPVRWVLVVVLGALLLLSLAVWQWQRAEEKLVWLAQQASAASARGEWRNTDQVALWQGGDRVKLAGQFEPACRVALDNQPMQGKTGYHLHQVFRLEGSKQAVLVNLGWLPSDRQQGPAIPAALTGSEVLAGSIHKPSQFYTAGDAEMLRGVWRVGRIDVEEWQRRCRVSLMPWVIRLSPHQPNMGYVRQWQPTEQQVMGPDKHRAYAFQWLALAVTWCLCWWRLGRYVVPASPRNAQKGSSRWVVLALLASFTVPFLIGQLAYERQWIGGGATNKGQLISPPIALREQLLLVDQAVLNGRWWLSYVVPKSCQADCLQSLETLTRMQATLGRERDRVGLLLIQSQSQPSIALPEASKHVHIATVSEQALQTLGLVAATRSPWLIMDPQGWVMLRYEPALTNSEALTQAQNVLDDLKKLLKASRIG